MNREKNWYSLSGSEIERVFRTDGAKGLSQREAARRLRHGKNTVWEVKSQNAGRYAVRSFFDLATVLLVVTVLCCAFFGSSHMAVAICIILALGRGARIAVYIWSEKVLEANAKEALPRAKVVRSGTVKVVSSENIAPGDVIILDTGDTVPCDIRLTAADNILVAESRITGNDGIVSKNSDVVKTADGEDVPLAKRTNMVYASGVIISGFAVGIAVATGDDTLVCTREGRIILAGEKDVSTVEKLSEWGRICSLCLVGAALVITLIGIVFGNSTLADAFLPSIAMAAAGLSEYIAAVGTFAWAKKLRSSNGCVLSRASIAEKAANAQVMVLRSVSTLKSGKTTLHSYYVDEKLTLIGTKDAKIPSRLLRLGCYCTGISPAGSIAKGSFGVRPREAGILPYKLVRQIFEENKDDSPDAYTIVQHIPAGNVDSGGLDNVLLAKGNEFYFCTMGSVDRILAGSSYQMKNGEKIPFTESDRRSVKAYADELKKHGVTLAAIGFRDSHYNNLRRLSVLQSSLTFEGFIAVSERSAEGVVPFLSDFRKAGGRVVVFSDNGEEDKCYAEAEGVYTTGDRVYTKKESEALKGLTLEEGSLCIVETTDGTDGIKERLRILKLISENELCTIYVGFGVEDMWNMRNADVTFAVPAPGGVLPQGIRTQAHGIADSQGGGFGEVCKIIDKCRKAMFNIRNILTYLVISHVSRLVLMLLSAALGLPLPSASMLVFWGVVLDFFVALATATVEGGDAGMKSGQIMIAPDRASEVLVPTMYGALCAVVSLITPICVKAFVPAGIIGVGVDGVTIMTCAVLGCLLAMPVLGAEYAGGYGLFSKKSRLTLWYAVPFALSIFVAVPAMLVPAITTAFGAAFLGWIMWAATLIPAAIMVAVTSVVRAINKK